jgi:GDP-D-mannose dehydratase
VDYVKAMWLMLQQEKPDGLLYCCYRGVSHTVEEFCDEVFGDVIGRSMWKLIRGQLLLIQLQKSFSTLCLCHS